MKTKILSILTLAAAIVGLPACSEDWNPKTESTGKVSFEQMGVEVSGVEKVVSRSEVDLSDYLVTIYDKDGLLVRQWAYKDVPEIFELPVADNYRVDIVSHSVKPSAWDEPLFRGSQVFNINKNEITNIGNITCTFASLKVSVRYTQALLEAMSSDSKVTVEAGKTQADVKTALEFASTETRSGFFEVIDGSMTLIATFRGQIGGNNEETRKVYTDVEPGKHYIITFSLKKNDTEPPFEPEPSGNVGISVSIDNVVNDEDVPGVIDPSDDPINPDDPNQEQFRDKITVTSALSFTDEIPVSPAPADAKVVIAAPNGLIRLSLALSSDNTEAAALSLADFGLPTAANAETELTLDFAALIARLAELPGLHTVSIAAEDADGNTADKTLRFRTSEPSTIDFETELFKDGTPMLTTEYAEKAVVDILVPNGLKNLIVTITPGTEEFGGILDEYGLLQPFDMVNPGTGTTKEYLVSLNLIQDGVDLNGATSVKFDIRSLIPLLNLYPAQHKFNIKVTDLKGAESSLTLVFIGVQQ